MKKWSKMEKLLKKWSKKYKIVDFFIKFMKKRRKMNICGFHIRKLNGLKTTDLEVCKVSTQTGTKRDFPHRAK